MKTVNYILRGLRGGVTYDLVESSYPQEVVESIDTYKDFIKKMGYSISVYAELPNGEEIFLDLGSKASDYDVAAMEEKVAKHL